MNDNVEIGLGRSAPNPCPSGPVVVSTPRISCTANTATETGGRYGLGPARMVDLKGKGPTPAHALVGPSALSGNGSRAETDASGGEPGADAS